jgi:LmbE family N-acetylglucosaminyl deacetylase
VARRRPAKPSADRIVVISPHLDDGVLSLGASIAALARGGALVEQLVVLGCDPGSGAPSGGWDRRGGFATEGAAARGRREEDRRACAEVGAEPVWLPFGSVDYERHGDEDDVRRAVAEATDGADLLLVPGSPLSHPDHEWLVRTLGGGTLASQRTALYAEQPYTRRSDVEPSVPGWLADAVGGMREFAPAETRVSDRVAKWRAIRHYRSQLPLLAIRRELPLGPRHDAFGREWVAWAEG